MLPQIVQRPQRLLDGDGRVGPVQLIEVNTVGLEPAQTALDLCHDVVAAVATVVGAVAAGKMDLGGQHYAVPPPLEGRADDRLGLPIGVRVGRVYDVEPGVECGINQ